MVALVLGAWWALAEKLADRPTDGEVREVLTPIVNQIDKNTTEIRGQRDVLIKVQGSLEALDKTLGDVKTDLKERKRGR